MNMDELIAILKSNLESNKLAHKISPDIKADTIWTTIKTNSSEHSIVIHNMTVPEITVCLYSDPKLCLYQSLGSFEEAEDYINGLIYDISELDKNNYSVKITRYKFLNIEKRRIIGKVLKGPLKRLTRPPYPRQLWHELSDLTV